MSKLVCLSVFWSFFVGKSTNQIRNVYKWLTTEKTKASSPNGITWEIIIMFTWNLGISQHTRRRSFELRGALKWHRKFPASLAARGYWLPPPLHLAREIREHGKEVHVPVKSIAIGELLYDITKAKHPWPKGLANRMLQWSLDKHN